MQQVPYPAPFGGGLDKVEVRIPPMPEWRRDVAEMVRATQFGERKGKMRSQHYSAVYDLRPELSAILHFENKHGAGDHAHKLEIVESGRQSFGEIVETIGQVIASDPLELETMRIDTATDVEGVPVSFFHEHARIAYKRFHANYGSGADCIAIMGNRGVETLYSGKSPNCYRIYNKTEKWLQEYRRITRGWMPSFDAKKAIREGMPADEANWRMKLAEQKRAKTLPPPSFAEMFGVGADYVLTRVERQIGSQQIREVAEGKLRTLDDLKRNVCDFNPYARLQIASSYAAPNPSEWEMNDWLAGMQFRALIERDGYAMAVRWLTATFKSHHMKKWLEKFSPFVPARGDFSEVRLFDLFRDAVQKQLAA